jgi:hypothetical protein
MNNPYQTPQTGVAPVSGGTYSQRLVAELLGTKPWVQFIAVLGFIGTVFMIIFGVGGFIGMMALSDQMNQMGGGVPAPTGAFYLLPLIYLVIGVFYFFLSLRLWKYGSNISLFAMSGQPGYLEEAIAQQRSFWKMTGLMIIVGFVLGIVGVALGGFMVGRVASEMQRTGGPGRLPSFE